MNVHKQKHFKVRISLMHATFKRKIFQVNSRTILFLKMLQAE